MNSSQIRQQFLDFFKSKGHTIVESSPVVPLDDPTLMFTNAGMNQFKDVFLGTGSRNYDRAADTQKCIRAGGKHNDLDDVGQDTYHHTYFEMLGNWSFGDYFKKEAIEWAWELLTGVWGIEKDRLHATYFEGDEAEGLEPDLEAAELWRTVTDINPANIHPGNKKDNFWEMGNVGPCGPCSELHIDLTPDKSGAQLVNAGDPRVIEIWNLVFIQFSRGSDGILTPLPAKHVDTGMGFERLVAVLEGMERNELEQTTNYDTDVFTPIFEAIRKRTGAPEYKGTLPAQASEGESASQDGDVDNQVMVDVTYRVIGDHLRCLTFALTDGAVPSNEGRGYVLRRILRRAVRYGRQYLGMKEPFLSDLVEPFVDHMGDVFTELRAARGGKNVEFVTELIRDEEASFGRTFDRGLKLYRDEAEYARKSHHGRITGEAAFKLHDTFGFTIDLTELMAEEDGLHIDIGEYERLMEEARDKARGTAALTGAFVDDSEARKMFLGRVREPTRFIDDWESGTCDATIRLVSKGERFSFDTMTLEKGDVGMIVTDQTVFYAEKGGQVADIGEIKTKTGRFFVKDVQQLEGRVIHKGVCVEGVVKSFDPDPRGRALSNSAQVQVHSKAGAVLSINLSHRVPTTQNHTSTHILNWALREVLGEHVQQKGSLVDPDKTRFDFSHNKPLTTDELTRIEQLCNEQVKADMPVYTDEVEQVKAREIVALRAVFGEKYPDVVRVVSVGAAIDEMLADPKNEKWMQYSVEFCGGTHLQRSGEAERFLFVAEEGVAKGIRRVVGISGSAAKDAEKLGQALRSDLKVLSESTGEAESLADRVSAFQQRLNDAQVPIRTRDELRENLAGLQKIIKKQEKEAASDAGAQVMEHVQELFNSADHVAGVAIVVGEVPSAKADSLRGAIDWVRNKADSSAVFLATGSDDKVTLIAGMSRDVVGRGVKAGDLIKEIAPIVGGRGGGRPDMAQGGGNDPSQISAAIERGKGWLLEKLA